MALSGLPAEILLYLLSFLEPLDIARLQQVSKEFRTLGRDDHFWRSRCLEESAFLENHKRRLKSSLHESVHGSGGESGPDPVVAGGHDAGGSVEPAESNGAGGLRKPETFRNSERARLTANWDLSYASEKVSWYSEYIQRHGPVAINWFEQPLIKDGSVSDSIDAKGVCLYRPNNPAEDPGKHEALLAVSPLDDGSVCLWDVNGTKGRRGAIYAKSAPGILFIDGPGADNLRRSKRVDSGVTECVSVDSHRNRAFVAVQSHLLEVDLERLAVVGCESFPWSITTLSTSSPTLPLTVGTSLGIHLYDYRARASVLQAANGADGIDSFDRLGAQDYYERSLQAIFNDEPLPPYASLSQPGPLSILHLRRSGVVGDILDDIYVAGRFSNILHYDRRKFPSIKGSIHSGARLCSLSSLPYRFSALDSELRRRGELTLDRLEKSQLDSRGQTIVACGEYNTKGALELYGLRSPDMESPGAGGLQTSTLKNRQTASQSKLLSVVSHGTRLAASNGSGIVKWFERDGYTEVRRVKIGRRESGGQGPSPSLFGSMEGSDDMARKLLPTQAAGGGNDGAMSGVNSNDLLFWTGGNLGLVSFSTRPGFTADDFEEQAKSARELELERTEREYGDRMRLALQRQAQDARFVRGLGLGGGFSG